MEYERIAVAPNVANQLRILAAEQTIKTGKRPTLSDLVSRGIELIRKDTKDGDLT